MKNFQENSASICLKKKKKKTFPEIGHRGNLPHQNKGHIQEARRRHLSH